MSSGVDTKGKGSTNADNGVEDKKAEVKQTQFNLKKKCKPKGWKEKVNGVKQACWCGELWYDKHEDGNHEDVWVKVKMPVLGKRKAEEVKEGEESDESEEELEEGWQKGWYGPVRCEE